MIISKKTLWKRAARAMHKKRYEEHLHETVRLAKHDPEYAKVQTKVFIQYVLQEVIENFNPPSEVTSW